MSIDCRLTAGEENDGAHVILRHREDAEGPQDASVSHFEVLRRASPAQDDVGIFRAALATLGMTALSCGVAALDDESQLGIMSAAAAFREVNSKMTWAGNFYRSAIGKKAVMAATGVILFGWIFLHMVGNLKLYLGAVHLNEYAHWLRALGTPAMPETGALWLSRLFLLLCVVLHIHAATMLTIMNRQARPVEYRDRDYLAASYASRTMRWGGVIILLFVIYHLLHLTTGDAHPNFVQDDVYSNVVIGLRVWWVAAVYIIANLALGFHLYHGLWSMFASVGWVHPKYNAWRRTFATTFAVIITAGNLSFPLAVLTGIVR